MRRSSHPDFLAAALRKIRVGAQAQQRRGVGVQRMEIRTAGPGGWTPWCMSGSALTITVPAG